ncbi:hypothetical protein ACKAV7_002813 [Fusarium commune]
MEDVRETHFLAGSDSYYKVLLVLLCPRLRSLKHLRPHERPGDQDGASLSLKVVAEAIAKSWFLDCWAPGLRSLREIALGIKADLRFQDDEFQAYSDILCRRMTLLPRVKSVYFGCLELSFFSQVPKVKELVSQFFDTGRCLGGTIFYSSMEHIFLGHVTDRVRSFPLSEAEGFFHPLPLQPYQPLWLPGPTCPENLIPINLLAVPKALKSLTVGGYSKGFSVDARQALLRRKGNSLESLIEYSPFKEDCGLFSPYFMASAWTSLSKMSVSVIKLIETGFHISDLTPAKMRRALSSEVIILRKSSSEDRKLDMECLEEILIAIVQCDDIYAKLKVLCLEQQEGKARQPANNCSFSKLVDIAWERRIDVYVRGNTRTRLHQLDLPEPPTMVSLERLRPQDQAARTLFCPFTGVRRAIGDESEDEMGDTENLAIRE